MMPHTLFFGSTAKPVPPICPACAEGDHERVLVSEQCSGPCHGTAGRTEAN